MTSYISLHDNYISKFYFINYQLVNTVVAWLFNLSSADVDFYDLVVVFKDKIQRNLLVFNFILPVRYHASTHN